MIPTATLIATITPTSIPSLSLEFELSGALGLEAFTVGLLDGGVALGGGDNLNTGGGGDDLEVEFEGEGAG